MPDWLGRAPFPATTREGEHGRSTTRCRRRARAALGREHGMHRHARVDVPRGPAGSARLGHVRPRPVRGRRVRRGDRGREARPSGARPVRARAVPEDERLAGDSRPRPDRAAARLRGGTRVRWDRRRRACAGASRPGHDRVDEGEAARASSSTRTRTARARRLPRSTRSGRGRARPSRRRSAGTRSGGLDPRRSRWKRCSTASRGTATCSPGCSRAANRSARPFAPFAERRSSLVSASSGCRLPGGGLRPSAPVRAPSPHGSSRRGWPSADSSTTSRRKNSETVQSATTRTFRRNVGSA